MLAARRLCANTKAAKLISSHDFRYPFTIPCLNASRSRNPSRSRQAAYSIANF